ncbi:MAG TPA: transcriptional regulator, partial [Pseudonocardiaceae bacterium]|nr:transcriptional regulator [Pseudonocardiaceae bacterium]
RQGDVDHGVHVGRKALLAAAAVKSQRVSDRMKPLEIEAGRRSTNPESRELAYLIRQQRTV